MSEFDRLPLESPRTWLRRLQGSDTALLSLAQQRLHAYYLADAKRLLQEEQQRVKWNRSK